MLDHPLYAIIILALLFLLALFIGRLFARLHIPRVTGYLLTGLMVGPSLSKLLNITPLLNQKSIQFFQPISDLALILILFSIGMQFKGQFFQRWRRQIVIFSMTEIITTALLVFILTIILNFFFVEQIFNGFLSSLSSSVYVGLILAILAVATAPAATLLVMREYDSEGPITDVVKTLVGLNNLVAIVMFIIAAFFLITPEESFLNLILQITAPLLIGIIVGFIISIWAERLEIDHDFNLLILGSTISILGVCGILGYDYLLASFICGVIVSNSSPKATDIINSIRQFDYPLYVIFFVFAGATLHIEALGHIGILGIAYLAARTIGKLIGSKLGAKFGQFGKTEQSWTGFAMVAQAGVAIGLCNSITKMNAPGHELITTIILGSVVIFEIFGPISIRFGLVRAGEVPLLTLLAKKTAIGSFEGFHEVINFFRTSIGIPSGHNVGSANDILVKHLMRTNVNTVKEDTPFNELLHFISHSNYDRFPVIDKKDRFVGVIDYSDIQDILFNPILSNLILAVDLVNKPVNVVYPEDTLGDVLKIFKKHKDISYLPVIDRYFPDKLHGILSQNDVLAAFRKFKAK